MTLSALALAASVGAAAPVAADSVAPMTIHYIRSFPTPTECTQYGYAYYGDPRSWFCVQNSNPDLQPWSLYADTSV